MPLLNFTNAVTFIEVSAWLIGVLLPALRSPTKSEHEPQNGFFYKMRYELVEADGARMHLEISTTRPETLMGDSAVAVHPKDERYKHLIGKTVWRLSRELKFLLSATNMLTVNLEQKFPQGHTGAR